MPTTSISRCGGTASSGSLAESIVGDPSLWAFYRLEESAGPTAADSGPLALHMTAGGTGTIVWAQGGPTFATQAPWFPVDSYVYRAAGFTGLAAGDMTVELWIYRLDGAFNAGIGTSNPFGTVRGWTLFSDLFPNHKAKLLVNNGATSHGIEGTTLFSNAIWYYMAAVRSAGTWTLYVNGMAEGTPITTVPTDEPDLWIAAVPANLTFDSNCRYSFAAVYNRAFSAAELAAHYALA